MAEDLVVASACRGAITDFPRPPGFKLVRGRVPAVSLHLTDPAVR